jgi:hypothetical protein
MKFVLLFPWAIIAIMGAVALAFVTGLAHPNEKVNGLWLVVAAVCMTVSLLSPFGMPNGDSIVKWPEDARTVVKLRIPMA